MQQLQQPNLKYIPSLTGLRAIAAFAVYFHHFPLSKNVFGDWAERFSLEFYIGVSIFFVLSGFLITLRYEDKFQSGLRNFKRYFINRFARIFPLYFILTTLTFILPYWLSLPPDDLSATSYILNITLLKGYSKIYEHTGISQGWTLTIEETFYLLAPAFFIYSKQIRYWMWIIILFAAGFIITAIFKRLMIQGFFNDYFFTLISTFFGRCFEFFVGIYLALLYKKKSLIPTPTGKAFATVTGAVLIFFTVIVLMNVSAAAHVKYAKLCLPGALIINFLLPPAIALFMYGLLTERSIFRRLLETNLFQLFGKSSYAFYLIHVGFIQFLLRKYVIDITAVTFVILIVLSVVIYKFVEEPLNKWIKKISLKPHPAQATVK